MCVKHISIHTVGEDEIFAELDIKYIIYSIQEMILRG